MFKTNSSALKTQDYYSMENKVAKGERERERKRERERERERRERERDREI